MQYNPYGYPAIPYNNAQNIPQSGTNDIMGIRWVTSIDEVKAASVPYGSRSMFMENSNQIFHIKDSNGAIRSFSFDEIEQPTPENFVTRKEFDELRSKYESLVQQQQSLASQPAQPIQANARDATLPGNAGAGQAAVLPANSEYESNGIAAQ